MSSQLQNFADQRRQMVAEQLAARGIRDARVLAAMNSVPREAFVLPSQQEAAYADRPLPIGQGQTISQPFTVAFMCEALQLEGPEKVLEIGTGCGYSAAVLAHLAKEVYSIERIPRLAQAARRRLQHLNILNVQVYEGDGTLGYPPAAPYEAIVVTAGGATLPEPYSEQLAENGKIVIPLGTTQQHQALMRYTKRQGQLEAENLGPFAFVPLLGKFGWQADEPE